MILRRLLCASIVALAGCRAGAQTTGQSPEWRVVADVPLPGKAARFDYQSFDSAAGRLWIAHMGAGEVLGFDVRTRRVVARVPDMPAVTGVRVVPSLERVFASLSGGHEVAVLDTLYSCRSDIGPLGSQRLPVGPPHEEGQCAV